MEEILIGEGVYAVGQARKIVTNAGVVNTGLCACYACKHILLQAVCYQGRKNSGANPQL